VWGKVKRIGGYKIIKGAERTPQLIQENLLEFPFMIYLPQMPSRGPVDNGKRAQ
jgi:hypothetical protein